MRAHFGFPTNYTLSYMTIETVGYLGRTGGRGGAEAANAAGAGGAGSGIPAIVQASWESYFGSSYGNPPRTRGATKSREARTVENAKPIKVASHAAIAM